MKTCSFVGCGNAFLAKGLCGGHYRQQRDGRPLAPMHATRAILKDPADPSILIVPLTRGLVAVVDARDADVVTGRNWQSYIAKGKKSPYAACREGKLHRMIAGAMGIALGPDVEVDHIDLNGLNCRRSNLRAATTAQNIRNRGAQRNNTSGFKGVSWHLRIAKWQVKIGTNGDKKSLGYYDDLELAAFVYAEAAAKFHGEFARAA